ncbi:hypothetical protein ACFVH7_12405 [Kitasatospora indigofera]|uniref:hypothetical protein n=1 Tax=Kitasatospora indigofera TaxID=67307 RepID=UPI003640B7A3
MPNLDTSRRSERPGTSPLATRGTLWWAVTATDAAVTGSAAFNAELSRHVAEMAAIEQAIGGRRSWRRAGRRR